jgi:hypothetical protein
MVEFELTTLCVCLRADFAATETGQCLPSSSKDDGRNDTERQRLPT